MSTSAIRGDPTAEDGTKAIWEEGDELLAIAVLLAEVVHDELVAGELGSTLAHERWPPAAKTETLVAANCFGVESKHQPIQAHHNRRFNT